jgi:hypothetical protein
MIHSLILQSSKCVMTKFEVTVFELIFELFKNDVEPCHCDFFVDTNFELGNLELILFENIELRFHFKYLQHIHCHIFANKIIASVTEILLKNDKTILINSEQEFKTIISQR